MGIFDYVRGDILAESDKLQCCAHKTKKRSENEYKKLISRPGPKNEIIFADLVEKLNQTIRKER